MPQQHTLLKVLMMAEFSVSFTVHNVDLYIAIMTTLSIIELFQQSLLESKITKIDIMQLRYFNKNKDKMPKEVTRL